MRRIFGAALIAGLVAGLLITLLQEIRVVPLILQAEAYETSAPATDHHQHEVEAWAPADGLERRLFTFLSNIVTAAGFGLLLTAAYALRGKPVDARTGLVWGLAGFCAFSIAPALGLPPDLPGMAGGDLQARQAWWVLTAAASAGGLALLAFTPGMLAKAAGLALIVLPHVIGAPAHSDAAGAVPPELAIEFAVVSLITAGLFWAALGSLTGALYRRFS